MSAMISPAVDVTIGDLIKERRKRKGWSQTVLGDLVGMSAATIHRIEHGEKIPTDDEAALIAGTLGVDHELMLAACSHTRQKQTDSKPKTPKSSYLTEWDTAHPANYAGYVWIQVTPHEASRHHPHLLTIRWGAWQRAVTVQLTDEQKFIYLRHYKHNDGQGLPLIVTVDKPVYLVFGKGKPPQNAPMQDITFNWVRVEPIPLNQVWNYLKHYVGWVVKRVLRQK